MILAKQGSKNVLLPQEYIEYKLMQKLNVNPFEFYSLPEDKIRMYSEIINIEEQYENRENQQLNASKRR